MQRTALAPVLLLATLAAATAQAQSFTDQARVRAVEPQYEVVQSPRQECTSQWVQEQPRVAAPSGGYGGAIIGGVAGGLLGNQVGGGRGKEAATAAGAVIGALTGDRIQNSNNVAIAAPAPEAREVRSCRTVYDQQNRLTGYRVTYDYRGVESTAVMREQPGSTIPVRVSVTPLEPEFRR